MSRTNHSIGVSIAALLASLAAGCTDGGSTYTSSGGGQCGEEVMYTFPLDSFEVDMLEAPSNPTSCMDMCRELSYSEPITCSWTVHSESGSSSGGASTDGTSAADGSTSTDGSTAGDATTTGDGSTGGTSTGGTTTGDATMGDATTTGEGTTSLGGIPRAGESGLDGAAGELYCTVWDVCIGGRGHAALQPASPAPTADALGEWLAAMAHSEAASVVAFRAIADELAAHGAPDALVQRAREAADDEVRHAEVMGALARRRGVEPARPRFSAIEVRELEALALENAVEGCVRETWAALEACCQARRAGDPELRQAMEVIAADESRHAQLSWDLDAWVRTRLSPEAVARIDAARRAAVDGLEQGVGEARRGVLQEWAGVPDPVTARRLVAELRRTLWS